MKSDILFINMPYSSLAHPSIALGLIKSYVEAYKYDVDICYANIEFAAEIGLPQYLAIDNSHFEQLMGEWTFSHLLFPSSGIKEQAYFALFSDMRAHEKALLQQVRLNASSYINKLADKIVNSKVKIVGCTSTFQQNCASLALLKRVKELDPRIVTLMGGANCEGEMGAAMVRKFPWIDYLFSGECDQVIGRFIDDVMQGNQISPATLPHGFISQTHVGAMPRATTNDMRHVGVPNYDDYFAAIKSLHLEDKIVSGLLIETSRGCWWGAKKHCTFCGLNGDNMAHRAKSATSVKDELCELSTKYGSNKFEFVDNILPMEYLKDLLPELAKERQFSMFYETKSNLKKTQIKLLADAGVKWIQPGFESINDEFLKLIDKGVTAVQNIAALKWCRSYGVDVTWNLLYGAPNEKPEWFEQMAEIVPLIHHFQPANPSLIKIRFARFSPYFNAPQKYGLKLTPIASYFHVYELPENDVGDIAYFFKEQGKDEGKFQLTEGALISNNKGHNALQKALTTWVNCWELANVPVLFMSRQSDKLVFIDTRSVATNFSHTLTGIEQQIYLLCEEPNTLARIITKVTELGLQVSAEEVESTLDELVNHKLVLQLSNCYLSLALDNNVMPMPNAEDNPNGYIVT